MASAPTSKDDQDKISLQTIILTAVYNNHIGAVTRALEVIRDQKLDVRKSKDGQRDGKQVLDFLPQKDAPVDSANQCHSPLMLACELKNMELVQLLLEEGASVAFKNKDGLNALHIACNAGNLEICKILLKKAKEQNHFGKKKKFSSDLSIVVNAKQKRGWTPLMYAAKKDSVDIFIELVATESVEYMAKHKNFLHVACRNKSIEILKHIVKKLPPLLDDDLRKLFMAEDENGWNILHHSCAVDVLVDDKCLTQWLLENIPEKIFSCEELLRSKNKAGYSPLLVACEYSKFKTVEYLASRDDVDVSDFAVERSGEEKTGEKSALHLAAIHDSHEIARVLVDKRCKIDRVDSRGDTALHIAKKKSSENVETILENAEGGLLMDIRNKDGKLPAEIEAVDIIPLEIEKQGPEMVKKYKEALREGKVKIPHCGLLFLGQERKGKTSLYKLLVGKDFDQNQESTKGIDNNEVSTVDSREITMEWQEKSKDDQVRERERLHASAIIREIKLPENQTQKGKKKSAFQTKAEKDLLKEIDNINAKIAKRKVHQYSSKLQSHAVIPEEHRRKPESASLSTTISFASSERSVPIKKPTELSKPKSDGLPVPIVAKKAPALKPVKPKPPSQPIPKSSSPDQPKSLQSASPVQKIERATSLGASGISYSDIKSFSKVLKNPKERKLKPPLRLNVLDFAGQKNYRPMHHCFITRRAMYLVVFNLQDMREYILALDSTISASPIEEIRYWLHSIHAHIYPPGPEGKVVPGREDKCYRRVILVGTHQNPDPKNASSAVHGSDLEKIDQILRTEVLKDSRCVNHLHIAVHSSTERCFVAVENSLRGDESGGPSLQQDLTNIASKLEFLEDEYPVSWLRLERKLMHMQNSSNFMCYTEDEITAVAQTKGVSDKDRLGPKDALEFFHDTGKIILLRRVPTLFLSPKEISEISNLVILDPKWLISAMQVIMELDTNDTRVTGEEQNLLQTTGKVSFECLKKLWSSSDQCILKEGTLNAQQLCLILQAYCLIHPADYPDKTCQGQPVSSSESSSKLYLVPSLLPEAKLLIDRGEIKETKSLKWISFYFDFADFLPLEIYHRLICLLLAAFQQEDRHRNAVHYMSKTLCRFDNIKGCHWKVELQEHQHRLKVSVVISPQKQPSEYVKLLHHDFLKRICKESGLQGLRYVGGAIGDCDCQCVLEFVSYDVDKENAENRETTLLTCAGCYKSQDMDEILNEQVSSTTSDTELNVLNIQKALDKIKLSKSKNGNLGRALNVPEFKIEALETENSDDLDQVRVEIIRYWMKNELNCCWTALAEAAEKIGEENTAKWIRKCYCQPAK